jgi:hypothetical protein
VKTDLYTKIVLTAIAICLFGLLLQQGGVPTAQAQHGVAEVSLQGMGRSDDPINVRLVGVYEQGLEAWESVHVDLQEVSTYSVPVTVR